MKIKTFYIFLLLFAIYQKASSQNNSQKKVDEYALESKDSLVGKSFIEFESITFDKQKFKLSDYKNKIVLLNFWFIGCPPCMGEIPDINKLFRTFKDSNVVIVSLCRDPQNTIEQFKKGNYLKPPEPIEYPIIPDCSQISNLYHVVGYPTTVIIDKKGLIRVVYSGATITSLKKFVAFYGANGLPDKTKELIEKYKDAPNEEMSDILKTFINELLQE